MNLGKNAPRSSSSFAGHCDRAERLTAADGHKAGRQRQQQANNSQHGRKSQSQHLSGELCSLFPPLNGSVPIAASADRAGMSLLERDPILRRASGGFRLFVRKFTDQQLLNCLRAPALNTLGQWAPPHLRYIHVLRNAWKNLTQFERFDWQEQFGQYAKNGQSSDKLGISLDDDQLLEGGSTCKEDEQRICQIQWLSTVDSDHLPCPLCSFGNPRRYSIRQLLAHLSLSHHSAHLYACHCCSKAFCHVEALKEHGANGECRAFLRYMRENVRSMGDELVFDFAYASLICAECGLHVVLSPRCDLDILAEALLSIILSHSSQSLALCLTYASVELSQPSVKIQFLRPLVFEPVPKCEFCLRSGWNSPMELERHCAVEHSKWATDNERLLQCPECAKHFYTAPMFCDHLLSKHLQSSVSLSTQFLRTVPQCPPALDKSGTVLLGTVGIDRFLPPHANAQSADLNPLKWVPAAERAAREGELRRSKRKRKRRRLHTPALEDEEEEVDEDEEEDDFDEDWAETETSKKSRPSGGGPSLCQSFGRWKTKMRLLEEKAFSSDSPLFADFVAHLELPVQFSGEVIVQNTLDGALLTESVYQCSKCSAIISGESSVTEHIVRCHQIEKNDSADFELMLNEYVFDNVEVLFVAGNFPFTRIRCDLCPIDCCSIVSLRRHYAQCHGILCAFQRNRTTVHESAAVLLRRDWANTAFDRELLQQINSSHPPHCTSELESECNGSAQLAQLGPIGLSAKALYNSLLHVVQQQHDQHRQGNCLVDEKANDGGENGEQFAEEFKEEPTEERWEQEGGQRQGRVRNDEQQCEAEKSTSSLDKTSDGGISVLSTVVVVKEELNEEDESGEYFLNNSDGNDFCDGGAVTVGNASPSLDIKNELSATSSPSSNATFADFLHRSDDLTNNERNEQDGEEDEEKEHQLYIDDSDDQQQEAEQPFASGRTMSRVRSDDTQTGHQKVDDEGHCTAELLPNGALRRSSRKRKNRKNESGIEFVHKMEEEEGTMPDCEYSKNDQESLADHREADEDDHPLLQFSPKKWTRKRGRPRKREGTVQGMRPVKKTKVVGRNGEGKTKKKGRKMKIKVDEDEEWLVAARSKRPYARRKQKTVSVDDDEEKKFGKQKKTFVVAPAETEKEVKLNEVETIMKGMERHFHRKRGRPKKKALTASADHQQQQRGPSTSTFNAVAAALPSSNFVCFMCTAVEKEFDAFGLHLRSHPEQWTRCTICTDRPKNDSNDDVEQEKGEQHHGHDNKKHQRRTFDHPVHFLKHLIEFHMNFQNDRVQCPWCDYLIQFNLTDQRYRASAAMFRHMVYECARSSVCLLCGYVVALPALASSSLAFTDQDESTDRKNDQLLEHRFEKHQLIFDRFICFSCKFGFYSREQFLHHTCELAIRCICNPSTRFLTRDHYLQHLQLNSNNLKKHGLMQAEHEVDTVKRKCVLNEDYRSHVAMLEERKREEDIERETAKAVAEIKKKVANEREAAAKAVTKIKEMVADEREAATAVMEIKEVADEREAATAVMEIKEVANETEIKEVANETEIKEAANETEIKEVANETETKEVANETETKEVAVDTEIKEKVADEREAATAAVTEINEKLSSTLVTDENTLKPCNESAEMSSPNVPKQQLQQHGYPSLVEEQIPATTAPTPTTHNDSSNSPPPKLVRMVHIERLGQHRHQQQQEHTVFPLAAPLDNAMPMATVCVPPHRLVPVVQVVQPSRSSQSPTTTNRNSSSPPPKLVLMSHMERLEQHRHQQQQEHIVFPLTAPLDNVMPTMSTVYVPSHRLVPVVQVVQPSRRPQTASNGANPLLQSRGVQFGGAFLKEPKLPTMLSANCAPPPAGIAAVKSVGPYAPFVASSTAAALPSSNASSFSYRSFVLSQFSRHNHEDKKLANSAPSSAVSVEAKKSPIPKI